MHELSLAESIVRTAVEAAGDAAPRICCIAVEVGALSATNVPSLEFCLALVLERSGLAGAQVRITEASARARCHCGAEYEPPDAFSPCPECGGFERDIVAGQDVFIQYVETEDA